ncbi:hypothetical protein PF005_g16268 [Phytophthora fragariae]|uniref:Uncharacterized protein n=1 Tax=Phytophthora fragariae TaxID=53985 RepID=A0A6A3XHY7_9STRA|nr:hypothetical protein PF009_g18729 [Phytophthora fragariae]KAE8995102.1 hypothetical protein PF011_g16467 [Phytophthora fragariae]KAE9126470.1 hypothetical protein PF006_g16723 [Phytophthora fragariae]KAE9198097.1 hypothetical protein PF005_g16268 [Phytophthora fragariae]KAE9245200.1 hypothetical protein PF002_g7372 [Phytophthora fragariae]
MNFRFLSSFVLSNLQAWSSSEAVATILYNCAVERLDNRALSLCKRGFLAISKRLPAIDAQLKQAPPVIAQRIILTTNKAINDEEIKPDEDALMRNLFAMVRVSSLKHWKQVYVVVYNFAAATCDGIDPKSPSLLLRKWEGLKRTQNRSKKKCPVDVENAVEMAQPRAISQCGSEQVQCIKVALNLPKAVL